MLEILGEYKVQEESFIRRLELCFPDGNIMPLHL